MSYLILGFSHNYVQFSRGPLSVVVCTSFMICEFFFAVEWKKIYGAQMVLTMKLISVAFDMDEDVQINIEKQRKEQEEPEKTDSQITQNKKSRKRRGGPPEQVEEPPIEELILSQMPTFFEYFGYALCPGTTVFGPWVAFKEYMNIYDSPRWVIFIFDYFMN